MDEWISRIESRLKAPLPGLHAQLRMITSPRFGPASPENSSRNYRGAGVLVLVYPLGGRPHVLLTRRSDDLLHHKGQISFPGGRREPGEDLRQTALREAREELGVFPQKLRILGDLTPLYVPPSRFRIHPLVAYAAFRPAFHPQPDEVAEIIEVPLALLLDPGSVQRETRTLRERRVNVPYYPFQGHKIWGATAMVLAEFLDVIRGAGDI
jgi:8-oxo-dGTP pyrophosphatase MutT (NUDIX family)